VPRTAITPTVLNREVYSANNVGVAIDQANGMTIANVEDLHRYVIIATATAAGNMIVRAGVDYEGGGFALKAGQGDLTQAFALNDRRVVVVDGARHLQADGSVSIDFAAGVTGTIAAFKVPRGT
jgi:hypothetical protein